MPLLLEFHCFEPGKFGARALYETGEIFRRGKFFLDFRVVDDALLLGIYEQHLARLQAPFLGNVFLGNR